MGNDKRTIGFDLHVGEKKNFEEHFFLKSLDPGDYAINGEIIANGGTVYTDSKTFSVNLFQNIIYDKKESSNILGRFITLTAFNDGNTQANALLKDAVTPTWYAIFSGPDPTGELEKNTNGKHN